MLSPTTRSIHQTAAVRKRGLREANEILSQNEHWQTPLELLLETMNRGPGVAITEDGEEGPVDLMIRLDCAKAAAPYVHSKLSTVTNVNPNDQLDAEIKQAYLANLQSGQNDGPPPPMDAP